MGETLLPHSLSAWTTFVDDGAMRVGNKPNTCRSHLDFFPRSNRKQLVAIMQELGPFRVTSGTFDTGVYA